MPNLLHKNVSAVDENFILSLVRAASTAALAAVAIFSLREYVNWSRRIRKTRQDCLKLGDACDHPLSRPESELMRVMERDSTLEKKPGA